MLIVSVAGQRHSWAERQPGREADTECGAERHVGSETAGQRDNQGSETAGQRETAEQRDSRHQPELAQGNEFALAIAVSTAASRASCSSARLISYRTQGRTECETSYNR